jgi:hypothetical protein
MKNLTKWGVEDKIGFYTRYILKDYKFHLSLSKRILINQVFTFRVTSEAGEVSAFL